MENEVIRSRQNRLVKLVCSLDRKKEREATGLFKLDGVKLCYEAIVKGQNIPTPGVPESFKVLVKELQSLCLDIHVLDEDGAEIELSEFYGDDAPAYASIDEVNRAADLAKEDAEDEDIGDDVDEEYEDEDILDDILGEFADDEDYDFAAEDDSYDDAGDEE